MRKAIVAVLLAACGVLAFAAWLGVFDKRKYVDITERLQYYGNR